MVSPTLSAVGEYYCNKSTPNNEHMSYSRMRNFSTVQPYSVAAYK